MSDILKYLKGREDYLERKSALLKAQIDECESIPQEKRLKIERGEEIARIDEVKKLINHVNKKSA